MSGVFITAMSRAVWEALSTEHRRAAAAGLRAQSLRTRRNLRPRGTLLEPAVSLLEGGVVGFLRQAVRDRDEQVRATIVAALGDLGGADEIPVLLDALSDEALAVAEAAAVALGQIGGLQAAYTLALTAQTAGSDDLRLASLTALERLADAYAAAGEDVSASSLDALRSALTAIESDPHAGDLLRLRAGDILELLGGRATRPMRLPFPAQGAVHFRQPADASHDS